MGSVGLGSAISGTTPNSVAVSGRYVYVASYAASTLQVFDMGGAYVQHLEAGAVATGTLQVRDTVTVGQSLNVCGDLATGGTALVTGALSVSGMGIASTNYALTVYGPVFGGTYNTSSDARYKTNIASLSHALDKIMALRGVEYDWRSSSFPQQHFDDRKQIGFVAQEIKEVLPEVVSQDGNGFYSVAYSKVIPVLVEAIKEQQKEMENQQKAIKEKNEDIEALKQSVDELKKLVQSPAEKK